MAASIAHLRALEADPCSDADDGAVAEEPARSIDEDLASLYRAEAPRLRRMLTRRLSPERAADLVQTTFLRVLGLGTRRPVKLDQPGAYLTRIAGNLMRDEARSAFRRSEALHFSIETCELPSGDPHDGLEARDLLRRVNTAIDRLPQRTREIFMAHRFEDLTYPQIAERMGVSVKTVEKHISAALAQLHRSLGPFG